MAKAEVNRDYISFVKGLITEATELTFPENASIDEDNMVLNRDGSRQRRLGMDFETSATHTDTSVAYSASNTLAITSHKWDNVANNPTLSFLVIQFGLTLFFFNRSTTPISGQYKSSQALSVKTGGSGGTNPVIVSSGNGILIVTSDDILPQYISYDLDTDAFSTTTISIKVRDFWGVTDSLDVDEQPTTLSEVHKYNLLNQGWTSDHIDDFFADQAKYPSNAQIDWYGHFTDVSTGKVSWAATQVEGILVGTTPAPKGKFVIDAFERAAGRESESNISPLTTDIERNRPTITTYAWGRAFFGGCNSNREGTESDYPIYNGYIFFSPISETTDKLGNCYQEADPTSEKISDLIATDGGTIQIAEINQQLKFIPTKRSILVVCDNGVWEVRAGEGNLFGADSYHISKITDQGAINQGSIVHVDQVVFYWNEAGIYLISPDETTGAYVAQNITETTIQTYYSNISSIAKSRAVGVYEAATRKVRWLYSNATGYDGISYKNSYNKELIFDLVLKAFYPHTISTLVADAPPFVAGYTLTSSYASSDEAEDVTQDGVTVTQDAVDVTQTTSLRVGSTESSKYIVMSTASNAATGNWRVTLGEYNNTDFMDWKTADATGITFSSYLHTGYEILGETARKKRATYFTAHFTRTETGFTDDGSGNLSAVAPSGCLVQGRWDFANHTNSGKYTSQFQAYRLNRRFLPTSAADTFDYGKSVITTKNKLRGSGRSLTIYFNSETGKDMNILGWNISFTGGTRV